MHISKRTILALALSAILGLGCAVTAQAYGGGGGGDIGAGSPAAMGDNAEAGYNDAQRTINDNAPAMNDVKQALQGVETPTIGAVPAAINGPDGGKSVEVSQPGTAVTATKGQAPGAASGLSAADRQRMDTAAINRGLPTPKALQ